MQQEGYHRRREEKERAQEEQQRWLQALPEERATRRAGYPKSGLPEKRATRTELRQHSDFPDGLEKEVLEKLVVEQLARTATLMDSLVSGAPTEYLVGAGEGGRDVMELNYRCIIYVGVSHVA